MLAEVFEQPAALALTLAEYVSGDRFIPDSCKPARERLSFAVRHGIIIAASGSSRHAGPCVAMMFETLAGVPVDVQYASEFRLLRAAATWRAACLVISQFGETADTLAAMRAASAAAMPTPAITNVPESSMAGEATVSFPTIAGNELAIPATKSFTTQVLNLYLLALLSTTQSKFSKAIDISASLAELQELPASIDKQLLRGGAAERRCTKVFPRRGNVMHRAWHPLPNYYGGSSEA